MAFSMRLALALALVSALEANAAVNKAKPNNGAKLCKEEPDIIVERNLALTGYHRELQTVIHTRNRLKVKGRPPTLLLLETVPSGAYVDAHQLRLLDDSDATFGLRGKVDVEEMAHQASGHSVFTFLPLNETSALAALPIHLRYHKAQNCLADGPFAKVTLHPPSIYFRHPDLDFPDTCEDLHHLPCEAANMERTCLWKQLKVANVCESRKEVQHAAKAWCHCVEYLRYLPSRGDVRTFAAGNKMSKLNDLSAEVPVGCLEDGFLVSTTTLVTYSLCSIAIAYYVFMHGKKPRSD